MQFTGIVFVGQRMFHGAGPKNNEGTLTLRSVNIGMGDPGYKSRWGANPSFQLVDWIAFRPGVRGYFLDFAHRMRRSFGRRDVQASESWHQPELPASSDA